MTAVVFVHGTGVRRPAFDETFAIVRRELLAIRDDLRIVPCEWGEQAGTKLHAGGQSIPTFAETKDVAGFAGPNDIDGWAILYLDPLFELRILGVSGPPAAFVPGGSDKSLGAVSPASKAALNELDLLPKFEQACAAVLSSGEFANASQAKVDDLQWTTARAIAAATAAGTLLSAETRDALVSELAPRLDRGVGAIVAKGIKQLGSRWMANRRGALSDAAFPFPGDVLLYQVRGDAIRDCIRAAITEVAGEEVIIIAHSLGGIGTVDLLVSQPFPEVKRLITVGSQSPLLYELDALWSLRFGSKLPAHFPFWSNVYDLRDFLSYVGSRIFHGVEDLRVDNGQPFPESHSAYWTNRRFWDLIKTRLP